jgi:hypothetical protein
MIEILTLIVAVMQLACVAAEVAGKIRRWFKEEGHDEPDGNTSE